MKTLLCMSFVFFAFGLCMKESDVGDFTDKYEKFTFSKSHIKKRYADNFELNIQIDGKDLTLVLSPNDHLTQRINLVSDRSFLNGFVKGFEGSIVRLSMEDNFLEGIILLNDETIYVENIEANEEGHNTALYKSSSIKREQLDSFKSRCEHMETVTDPDEIFPHTVTEGEEEEESESTHTKRNVIKDCTVALIADKSFSNKYGADSIKAMVSVVNAVEGIYLKQLNVGLPIIYTYVVTSTSDPSGLGDTSRDCSNCLDEFRTALTGSKFPNYPKNACIAHLFVYRSLGGPIGRAGVNTICSTTSSNTGITTFGDATRELNSAVKIAIVAHEIGHNFGSRHDTEHPDPPGNLPECNPTVKFIMYPYVSSTSIAFSVCSLYSINQSIKTRGSCLTTRNTGTIAPPTTAPPTTAPPTIAPPTTRPPTTAPPTAPPTTRPPTTAPPTAPPTTRPPTTAPPTQPPTRDRCARDSRIKKLGNYTACPFQPRNFDPCVLFCAKQGVTNRCTYFILSSGRKIPKYAGTPCGNGKVCSYGICTLRSEITDPDATEVPPTRAPTLPPTTSPTSNSSSAEPPNTASPQPQCPDWAPIECSTNDCQLRCSYDSNCFLFDNRPDGTHCGGSGRCISGACRPFSAGITSSECNPNDACCDANGNIRPHGYVCRPSENSCDIPEICNPENPRPSLCPEDETKPGGTPCNCSDLSNQTTCTAQCGMNEYNGVCGKIPIESCEGKICEEGFECYVLKGLAKCVPKSIGSCQDNCGKSAALTVGCYCDDSCQESGDCCDDYKDFCVVSKDGSVGKTAPWVWAIVGTIIALAVVAVIAGVGYYVYKKKKSIRSV